VTRPTTPEFWSKQKKPERKFLRRLWNFAIHGSRVTTLDRVANCNWPPKFKPVPLPKYNGFGNSRQFLMRYESTVNSTGGDDVVLAKSFIIAYEGPVLNWYSRYSHTQFAAGSISRQSSFKNFRYFMKQQPSHQICTTASRKTESHCGIL
jgi:hypothetical protein